MKAARQWLRALKTWRADDDGAFMSRRQATRVKWNLRMVRRYSRQWNNWMRESRVQDTRQESKL